jgi:inosose dehydratase
MRLATGPVTWGVDFADTPTNPPWERVLDEIAASGVGALGPVGYLPEDPETLRDALATRELVAVGSFVFDDFHEPSKAGELAVTVARACRAIAAAGGTVLVLIDRPSPARVATAGRPSAAPRLDRGRWEALLRSIEDAASIAREHGIRPVVHPHAGGWIEFRDEVERLLEDSTLDLCLDTGHVAYARMDACAAVREFGARLGHVHLKDVDGGVLDRVEPEWLDFWAAVAEGVFCPIGEGVVDVRGVVADLARAGYDGFATIEQDRVPGSGRPLDDLRRSLHALESRADRV